MKNYRIKFLHKLLLLVLVPLIISQAITLFATSQTAASEVRKSAYDQLRVSTQVVSNFIDTRDAQIKSSLQVLVSDFALKSVIATGDQASIQSALENHRARVEATFARYKPLDDNIEIRVDNTRIKTEDLYAEAALDESVLQLPLLHLEQNTYQVYAAEVRAPTTIGYVLFGFRVDEGLVSTLQDLSGMEISILSLANNRPRIIASSRAPSTAEANQIAQQGETSTITALQDPGLGQWLTFSQRLSNSDPNVLVTTQLSLQAAMAPYIAAKHTLTWVGVGVTLIAAMFGLWFSASVSNPLRRLAQASQRMRDGYYDSRIPNLSNDELGELAESFNALQIAIEEREASILHSSRHNPLTDLPNYAYALAQLSLTLEHAREENLEVAVAQIRLERLREIESSFGHEVSDRFVEVITRAMAAIVSEHDGFLAHTATDEFAAVFLDCNEVCGQAHIEKLMALVANGVAVDNARLRSSATAGLACFPKHAEQPEALLRYAAIACQDAVNERVTSSVYAEGREDKFNKHMQMMNDLPGAIANNALFNVYQPKVTLLSGQVSTVEALVRWIHPDLGFLNPDEFISIAEESGTITELTYAVLRQAISDMEKWANAGHRVDVAVNLSTRDLLQEDFCDNVLNILATSDAAADRLVLEVTESSMMEQPDKAVAALTQLRDSGIKIAMDDFGTGHSSLAQLRDMPIDQLKIDRAFVQTLKDEPLNQQIVANTIELAHSMELNVVAEGVEDPFAMHFLTALACEYAQGYFISKPIPSDELLTWLAEYEPKVYAERRGPNRAFRKRTPPSTQVDTATNPAIPKSI